VIWLIIAGLALLVIFGLGMVVAMAGFWSAAGVGMASALAEHKRAGD
jgi:hypothetical protein